MVNGLISIDRWGEESQAYFLTHLHADHTRGLSSRWARGPLYLSPLSAKLLPSKFPGFDRSLLRALPVGSTHRLPLVSKSTGSEIPLVVTVIDAHHCPGAVMYLFRGEFGCALYTGDFRWEVRSERAELGRRTLLDALGGDRVDVLYLDNTYCHPSFDFPPREVAAQQVVDIITMHPDHEVIIGVDTLGKEDLLIHISKALNTKIWVWPERLLTMHLLGFEDAFTTKTSLTRVRAVPRYSLTFDTLESLNMLHPTIGIMPSGLPFGVKPFDGNDGSLPSLDECYTSRGSAETRVKEERDLKYPPKGFHQYSFSVPYSEHSCFMEIEEFIKIVQPSNIRGIVSSSICYINPYHYFSHLCGESCLTGRPCGNYKHVKTEKIGGGPDESLPGSGSYRKSKVKEEKKFKAARLSVRRSRICIIRRERRGAKLERGERKLSSGV